MVEVIIILMRMNALWKMYHLPKKKQVDNSNKNNGKVVMMNNALM